MTAIKAAPPTIPVPAASPAAARPRWLIERGRSARRSIAGECMNVLDELEAAERVGILRVHPRPAVGEVRYRIAVRFGDALDRKELQGYPRALR